MREESTRSLADKESVECVKRWRKGEGEEATGENG